ncbi:hypothetical protein RI367_005119 [Sorochytrium milnesiophthora]
MSERLDTILVIGGSDGVGQQLAELAVRDPHFSRVGVLTRRDRGEHDWSSKSAEEKARTLQHLQDLGVKVQTVDYANVQELTEAMHGYKVVVSMVWSDDDDGCNGVFRAAAAAGVQRFVPNVWGVDYEVNSDLPWLGPRKAFRERVQAAGLETTEMVIGFFLDNIGQSGAPSVCVNQNTLEAVFYGSEDHAVSWTTRRDSARLLIAALKRPEWSRNRIVRAEADRRTLGQLTDLLEEVTGVKYKRTTIPKEEAAKMYTANEASPFAYMASRDAAVVNPHGETTDTDTLRSDVGDLQSMESYVRQVFQA